jgi:FlaA1/EpsC-like NDP-sugar epimerase
MQCISNNVLGTHVLAKHAIEAKIPSFVLISTDKAVNPTNFMGASKRIGELICQYLGKDCESTQFSVVRFGNVLGSSGSVVPIFKQQIKDRGPVTVTHKDVTRYFMTIPEAADLVIQAGAISDRGGIFVLDMGEPIKIMEIAKKMILLAGHKPVLNHPETAIPDSILIITTGLKPGEKLFEELSYDQSMAKTIHPRILEADQDQFPFNNIPPLLADIQKAIDDRDCNKLTVVLSKFFDGVASPERSTDVLMRAVNK